MIIRSLVNDVYNLKLDNIYLDKQYKLLPAIVVFFTKRTNATRR